MKFEAIRKKVVEEHEKLIEAIDKAEDIAEPMLDEMEKLEPTNTYFDTSCLNINITGDKHKLLAAIRILRRYGYKADSAPKEKSSDYHSWFHKDDAIMVWFHFSSTQCRRVKIGTKTVEQDVYETVCGEQEFPSPPVEPIQQEAVNDIPF